MKCPQKTTLHIYFMPPKIYSKTDPQVTTLATLDWCFCTGVWFPRIISSSAFLIWYTCIACAPSIYVDIMMLSA